MGKTITIPNKLNKDLYNGDFRKYYDNSEKRNIWVLGYFGSGSINIMDAYRIGCDYSNATGVPIGEVKIDEITNSRRFKGFKFVFSTVEQKPESDAEIMEDVYSWLRD